MKAIAGLARAMRPQQWVKNLFVFAPILFAQAWHKEGLVLRAAGTFAVFCLLSSGVYLFNDVADRASDRLHPVKRTRAIAKGDVPVTLALAAAAVLVGLAFALARMPPPLGLYSNPIAAAAGAYLVVQVLYTFWLKRVVILDVMCISSGFVLRLLAGGPGAQVPLSPWIIVCTIFVSLFLALCKRRHEVVSLGDGAAAHRAILADYPPALLDQLIGAATACTLVTYALYTVDRRTIDVHRLKPEAALIATLPFVIFGMFRYLFLVYRREGGGSPTSTLARDVPTVVNGVLYAATVLAVFHFASN
jgi:4-hydroxybenzoate polyprenyltransferase